MVGIYSIMINLGRRRNQIGKVRRKKRYCIW